ncbi:MAG: YidC/Oxa1 family membrane protein insertase [Acidimicrobiia bacterium]
MWDSLLDTMGAILAFFYAGIPSYGVAIIGLTVVVRLLLFPLTAKQARSMQKMQQIQPEIKQLQAKYKDDRQKLNEEVMKFYKENKVNPLAGCLPLVAQMPIFFGLFAVLRSPVKHIPEGSTLIKAFCDGASSCTEAEKGLRFLGMDLSQAASSAHTGFLDALPYFVLLALVVATGYFQFKQTQARQANPNPQMAMIGKIFPVMFALISLSLPSGTVLYFLVSNTWQIGQQALIFKKVAPPLPDRVVDVPGAKVTTKGPAQQAKKESKQEPKQDPKQEAKKEPKQAAPPARQGRRKDPAPHGEKTSTTRRAAETSGRAQPAGSRPRPKKRRR